VTGDPAHAIIETNYSAENSMSQTRKSVFEGCSKRLNGSTPLSVQKSLLQLANFVDPHLMPDVYGSGEAVQVLEQKVATILGKEAALFFPSGTMAQQVALRCWADRTGKTNVALHLTSHLEQHEENAYQILHPLKGIVRGDLKTPLLLKDLLSIDQPLGSVILELPQRHSGGILPQWNELKAMSGWCREKGTYFHMDGARLWECAAYYQKSYSEIAEVFDSVYVSFYKGLGAVGGAALAGPEAMISKARVWQRRHGGNLFNLYPIAISALHGLETKLERFPAYFAKAKDVSEIISKMSQISATPKQLQSNMMHLNFKGTVEVVEDALLQTSVATDIYIGSRLWQRTFAKEAALELYIGDGAMTLSNDEIKAALTILNDLIAKGSM
jgi:threonine aldolase